MKNFAVNVSFPETTTAEKSLLADELRQSLISAGWSGDCLSVNRDRAETQDAGTILSVLLSSGAAIALAKGLAAFATKAATRIRVTLPTGEAVVVTGDAATQARVSEVIAAALTHRKQ
jgi:hypothetical protein